MGRRLGQHFLSDPAILDRIVDALDPQPDDVVIEVGPGQGRMTRRLAARVGTVIAIERDPELASRLAAEGEGKRERGKVADVQLLQADALEIDWHEELDKLSSASFQFPVAPSPDTFPLSPSPLRCQFKVVGNIPYYITSPLIDKALAPPRPHVIVFLIQREVADRLVAPPGGKTYGALTVGVQAVARVERLFIVRPGSFNPPPKVDSAVVRITPSQRPLVADEDVAGFRRFTVALFSQRRKQLKRILRSVSGLGPAELDLKLAELAVDPTDRPENLEPGLVVGLFRALGKA